MSLAVTANSKSRLQYRGRRGWLDQVENMGELQSYCDKLDGTTIHDGYVVDCRWFRSKSPAKPMSSKRDERNAPLNF